MNGQAQKVNEKTAAVNQRAEVLMQTTEQQKIIIDLISEIAQQTNLLALNASIEAVKAGEAQKGFAVVAESITELENKTKEAIASIDEMVTRLQVEMNGFRQRLEA